jgi:hypothetical protein
MAKNFLKVLVDPPEAEFELVSRPLPFKSCLFVVAEQQGLSVSMPIPVG